MSLYIEQIRQLVALQHVDDGIHAVQLELESSPKEVEELKNAFIPRMPSATGFWKNPAPAGTAKTH